MTRCRYAEKKVQEYVNLANEISLFMFLNDEGNFFIVNEGGTLNQMSSRIEKMLKTKPGHDRVNRYLAGYEGSNKNMAEDLYRRNVALWKRG